jgi:hypothetical protein
MHHRTAPHPAAVVDDRGRANVRGAICGLVAFAGGMFVDISEAADDPAASVVFVQRTSEREFIGTTDQVDRPVSDLRLANSLVIGGMAAGVAAYGLSKWWDEGFTGQFNAGNEGWFGQDTPNGGADKLGHAYSANAGVRLMSVLFQSYGNGPRTAADLAFWSTFGTLTAVEVADGFSRQYSFSWEDTVMNAVGAGFGWWCETNPEIDDLLDFRLMYQKSQQASSWDPPGDYSGQTYLLVGKASGVPQLRDVPVLRYLEVAVGYGTRNYDGPPGTVPARNVYYGLQINLSALMNDTVFGSNRWPVARRASEVFFDLWQVQNTGVYAKSRL